ncbi:hypothetical protein GCM10022225_27250 [Plantactinospora mayteni]|uniref:Uncharacterized protein n=1 Tax=Plantactinospora mayteni TaxID=566021 RepID=A0ABQ4EIJ9_9ACTN|nr:hypothetical protein Pma05_11180 [Plantactinospora mayteni]
MSEDEPPLNGPAPSLSRIHMPDGGEDAAVVRCRVHLNVDLRSGEVLSSRRRDRSEPRLITARQQLFPGGGTPELEQIAGRTQAGPWTGVGHLPPINGGCRTTAGAPWAVEAKIRISGDAEDVP